VSAFKFDLSSLPAVSLATEARAELPANASRVDRAWHVLHSVLDPEVPALSICDLGIVRDVRDRGDTLEVDLTPTYSGCPATEVIERAVIDALEAAGLGAVMACTVLSPAWTSDWMSEEGRRKLREYGIAPPGRCGTPTQPAEQVVRFVPRRAGTQPTEPIACPRCDSTNTERLSAFGATACKALYRCRACREPFEAFKAI
jgi:ring-1,2-phenylacetyl-CoA epoxidase subunit PaaD